MNLKKALFLIVFISVTITAHAQGPGWSEWSTVEEIVITSNGGVNVRLSPQLTGCVSQSGYGASFASIYPSHPGIDRMHSNLLAALAAKKKVKLYFDNNQCRAVEMRVSK